MKNIKRVGLLMLLLGSFLAVSGQRDQKAVAQDKLNKAIELMDNNNPDDAIPLLQEAKRLDPGNYVYEYEIGYAWMLKKEYKKGIEAFKSVIRYPGADDRCYQMLGNLYDADGDTTKALETYEQGLKLFPNSGRLYLETGNLYWIRQRYDEALPFYEKGMAVDPLFPSNYFRAALLYINSDEEVWGMIYGEIFLNLERTTKRTRQMSKILYDTYKSQIEFTSDTSFSVSFSKMNTVSIDQLRDPEKFRLPFGTGIYEPTLILAVAGEKSIDLASLDRIRQKFINIYFEKGFNIKFPEALFDYQKMVADSGMFQAYNYWVLGSGDEPTFNIWRENNKPAWARFTEWFDKNQFQAAGKKEE